jgi:hypothetical protein
MMHDWDPESLSRLARKADLMFWAYHGHPDSAAGAHNTKVLEQFAQAGVKLWGACAYKGADSRGDAELPDKPRRVANAIAWADLARRFEFQGVIATGWSRYATSRIQCEPIDAALDVLIQVAHILHDGEPLLPDEEVIARLQSLGECERFITCRNALLRLSEAKRTAWECCVQAYQQASLERHDPTRRGAGVFAEMLRLARDQTTVTQQAADDVRQVLRGLVESVWVEEFIIERLAALSDSLDHCFKESISLEPMDRR